MGNGRGIQLFSFATNISISTSKGTYINTSRFKETWCFFFLHFHPIDYNSFSRINLTLILIFVNLTLQVLLSHDTLSFYTRYIGILFGPSYHILSRIRLGWPSCFLSNIKDLSPEIDWSSSDITLCQLGDMVTCSLKDAQLVITEMYIYTSTLISLFHLSNSKLNGITLNAFPDLNPLSSLERLSLHLYKLSFDTHLYLFQTST